MPLPSFLQRFRPGAHSRVHQAPPLSPADIEAARVRARRRMIGMAVLVGAGVIGFPWLFETQPRPLSADIAVVNASAPPAVGPTAPVTSSASTSRGGNLPAVVANASDAVAAAEVARAEAGSQHGADNVSDGSATDARASTRREASSGDAQASREPEEEVIETEERPVGASARDSGTARTVAKVAAVAAVPAAAVAAKAAHDEQAAQAKAEAKARQDAKLKAQAEAKAHQEAKARQEAKLKAEAKAKADAKLKAEALAKAASEARQKAQAKAKPDAVVAKADPKHAASKPLPKPEAKPAAKPEPAKADSDTRYIVQVGAFGDATTAHEVRMKVERLGIKTYTHEIGAGSTRKIRVRVGPYATKAEADKAMNTLRKGGLSGALLTL